MTDNQFDKIKTQITRFLEDRDWIKYHTPKNLAMAIAIEAGELMELFQWENPTPQEVITDGVLLKKVEDELADILIYVLSLARTLNIDAFQCIQAKIKKNNERFPIK
jgi:NTP pyrophosphatase (non-canonical NTP hydrolase)